MAEVDQFLRIDLNTVLAAASALGIAGSLKMLFSIRDRVTQLNGRMEKTEQWQEFHQKLDDDRAVQAEKSKDELGIKMNKLHDDFESEKLVRIQRTADVRADLLEERERQRIRRADELVGGSESTS